MPRATSISRTVPVQSTLGAEVLRALPAGVLYLDERGGIVACNEHGAELLRTDPKKAIGANVATLFAPMVELRARAEGDRGEVTLRHADGTESVLGYRMRAVEGGSVVLFQDISSILALRRERDRLLQLAAVGEVLPAVLHELRNPLAAVTNMLELLVEETSDELQRDLHSALAEVRRIALSLQGIGGIGQSVRGHRYEAIDEAIDEAIRVLRPTAASAGVELEEDIGTLPLLPIDRTVVKGVIFNLVRNAIDACRRGDRVRVTARLLGDQFELVVADTGRGMTPEVKARCCEIFFTTKGSGSGIGLAICRQAAERADGTLTLESEPGLGTTVTIVVPIRPDPPATGTESTRKRST